MPRNPNKSDWSGGLPACIGSFSVIEDPRTGGNKLHHFGEVLFMAISAMLCGMNCFSDIEDILALKGNQGNLHKEAQDQFHFAIRNLDLAHSEGWSYDQRIEKSNGRIVTRSVMVNHRLDWMDTEIRGKWRDLRSLIHVETQTTQLDSDEIRREVGYYISSLDEPASAFQSHIRQHWILSNNKPAHRKGSVPLAWIDESKRDDKDGGIGSVGYVNRVIAHGLTILVFSNLLLTVRAVEFCPDRAREFAVGRKLGRLFMQGPGALLSEPLVAVLGVVAESFFILLEKPGVVHVGKLADEDGFGFLIEFGGECHSSGMMSIGLRSRQGPG
jgi:predicted transposase YbfD/YdcC